MAAVKKLRSRTVAMPPMASAGEEVVASEQPVAREVLEVRVEPVARERARLRDQARKGKSIAGSSNSASLHQNSHSFTEDHRGLWPSILMDSDQVYLQIVPEMEGVEFSQLPTEGVTFSQLPTEGVEFDQLPGRFESVAATLERVKSKVFIDRQEEEDQLTADTDSSEEVEVEDQPDQPELQPDQDSPMEPECLTIDLDSDRDDDKMEGTQPAFGEEQTSTASRGARQLVAKEHVLALVLSYQKAFRDFKKLRKGVTPSQLIPSKVWKQVYRDYKKSFPNSAFKEDNLKDHLRGSLKDLNSRSQVEADDNGENPSLDEELMERLMATDSWKARNVLQSQVDAMHNLVGAGKSKSGSNENSTVPSEASGQTGSGLKPAPTASKERTGMVCKPPTKSQNLKEARQDMGAMLSEFKSMADDRRADASRKRLLAQSKATLSEAKRHESEQQRAMMGEQEKMAKINLIKEQKALGLITVEEFQEKCKQVFGL